MINLASLKEKYLKKPDNERDIIIRKNILLSFLFQFGSNLIGLFTIPLCLTYLTQEKYGIWVNASVMVTWLQNMNFGMGFGMQNKVTEALSHNDPKKANDYVTIVFRFTTIIAFVILIVSVIASFFINWNALFNTSLPQAQLKILTFVALACFLLYFVSSNIVPLFNALKLNAVPRMFGLLANILTIGFLFYINKVSKNNLVYASIALALPTPLIYIAANIYYFKTKFKFLKPRYKIADKNNINDVFTLGFKFFIMQISNLLFMETGIIVITQTIGPAAVTPYSVINRYFYFAYFVFSMALMPYWSAFTEAFVKKDFLWIKKTINLLIKIGFLASLIVCIMFAFSFYLIPIWSKHSFDIYAYKSLVITSAIYTITLFFALMVSIFLNGLSLLNYQILVVIFMAFVNLSLSLLLIKKLHWGAEAVNFAYIVCQLIFIIVCGLYAYKFYKKNI